MSFIKKMLSIDTDVKNRIYYLDILRGILILLVLVHHSTVPIGKYILRFHMPALFILSGYTEFILGRKKPFPAYVKAKFCRLVIPYFLFESLSLIIFVLREFVKGRLDFSFVDAAIDIITCLTNSYQGLYGRLWFLPAMFLCAVFSYVIRYFICKEKTPWIGVCCLGMFALAYIVSKYIPFRLPFTLDTSLLGTAFFLLGYLSGKIIKQFFERKHLWLDLLLLLFSCLLFFLCNKYARPNCFMYSNTYNHFPIMMISASSGTAVVGILTKLILPVLQKMTILNKVILWYSVNSLTVFPMHLMVKIFANPLLIYAGLKHWASLLLLMFVCTIPAVNFVNAYLPFMLGTFHRKK